MGVSGQTMTLTSKVTLISKVTFMRKVKFGIAVVIDHALSTGEV
jgi:hypothetical protein